MRKTTAKHLTNYEIRTNKEGKRPRKIYGVKARNVTEKEFKTLVKRANERLRQLERNKLTGESKEYIVVKRYAVSKPKSKGFIYNVEDVEGKGTKIRFKTNLSEFKTQAEKTYLINTIRNFLTTKTSTIGGVHKTQKKSFETFKKNLGDRFKDMTQEQYNMFWRTYRENVAENDKDHYSYNTIMNLLEHTDIMSLNEEDMTKAMSYVNNSRTANDQVESILQAVPNLKHTN